MNKEVLAMLATLVKEHALEPSAALEAAWKQGFKEADATFETRRSQAHNALQMQNMRGR